MGARAQEAVLFLSTQSGEYLRLLGILAAGADDETGLIDPAPTRESLADWTGVTQRTITNRIQKLVDDGELEVVRIGSGPGNPSAYRLTLAIPETTYLKNPAGMGETKGENLAERVKKIEETLAEMGEKIEALFTLVAEISPKRVKRVNGKGETASRGSVQTIPFDPLDDPEGKEQHGRTARAQPPSPLSDSSADRRTAAIAKVCGLDVMIRAHREACEAATVQLRDYAAETILARYLPPDEGGSAGGWNWYVDDWRAPEQPRPNQVVETIAKQRVKARASPNGRPKQAEASTGPEPAGFAAIRQVMEEWDDEDS
jgi:hypothetical protein